MWFERDRVFVNNSVCSDLQLPSGGVKESGYRRELSAYVIKDLANVKSVCVA